ncbi:hypothetical protein D1007_53890 [Hordeum vulgare]|nr:hypothetical protein D1007_53890 [Hordeum vulgare]
MVRDLAEEGKKRAVLLLVFAFGLAFLMSQRAQLPQTMVPVAHLPKQKSIELRKPSPDKKSGSTGWRSKVNSPPVEAAFEQFTRHLVTEWVTDLWLKPNIDFQYEVNAKGSSPAEILGTTYQTNLKPALKALVSGPRCAMEHIVPSLIGPD